MTETDETARRQMAYAQALADAWHALHVLRVVTGIDDAAPHDISAPARRAWHAATALRELTGIMARQSWYATPDMYERAGETYQHAVDAIDGIVDAPRVDADDIGTRHAIEAAVHRARVTMLTARVLATFCQYDDDAPLTDVLWNVHTVLDATAEIAGEAAMPWHDSR